MPGRHKVWKYAPVSCGPSRRKGRCSSSAIIHGGAHLTDLTPGWSMLIGTHHDPIVGRVVDAVCGRPTVPARALQRACPVKPCMNVNRASPIPSLQHHLPCARCDWDVCCACIQLRVEALGVRTEYRLMVYIHPALRRETSVRLLWEEVYWGEVGCKKACAYRDIGGKPNFKRKLFMPYSARGVFGYVYRKSHLLVIVKRMHRVPREMSGIPCT